MSSEPRRKDSRETYGNQNYLNFIKKNHQLIKDQFTLSMHQKNNHAYKLSTQNSCTFIVKSSQPQSNTPSNDGSNSKKVIHDSLSKFQVSSQNQSSDICASPKHKQENDEDIYKNLLKKNDEIAAKIMNNKIKNDKNVIAKDILFHLNKNRSPHLKKSELKVFKVDRYQSLEPIVQLNLKFPIIEKRNLATMDINKDHAPFLDELRDRVRNIQKRQKQKRQHFSPKLIEEQQLGQRQDELINFEWKDFKFPRKDKEQNSIKTRQELYGLIPSFKTPNQLSEHKRRHIALNKQQKKLKIQKYDDPPLIQILHEYLQRDIITKSIPFSQKIVKQKKIFNKQILDTTKLEDKQELELLENPKNQQRYMSQKDSIDERDQIEMLKQSQQKIKLKKQANTQIKYEGDLTIYQLKMRHYREFLFMINLAHRIYDPIALKDANTFKPEHKYKFYLGKGNNYLLVKSLLKRRFWWTGQQDPKKANFAWTQLKLNYLYQYQKKSQKSTKNHKLDKDFQIVEPSKKKKKRTNETKLQQIKGGVFKAPLPPNDKKIFTNSDKKYYDQFLEKADNPEKLLKFSNRLKYFQANFFNKTRNEEYYSQRLHNHLQYNYFIGNKKALFYNLKQFYDLQNKNVFTVIPLTFHLKHGTSDQNYDIFTKQFKRLAKQKLTKKNIKNIWIVKPGQLSNRGQGITVIDEIYELNTILKKKQKHYNGSGKTYIVQKYIEKPLLYKGRKFDIRHYMMISRLHGVMRAYWFGEGYIRTSSHEFNIDEIGDEVIHLTNDAIQKYSEGYGKYQEGNKVSYSEFQRYMDSGVGEGKFSFSQMIYPKMKSIALDAVKSTYLQLDPNNREHSFQIFGLDFMIDANYDVWLIQVNTNPCLELSSKLLARIIPTMVEQSLRLTLDVIFPPPTHYPNSQKYLAPDNPLERLQFQLIFDEDRDGKQIQELYANCKKVDMGEVDQQDETYENDGKEIQLENEIQ